MQRGTQCLSKGAHTLALQHERWQQGQAAVPQFDVVVVGSGYGGAVAAARLSALATGPDQAPMAVAVLERGLEYTPGSFPDRFTDLVGHMRTQGGGPLGAPANPEGLFDWRLDGDVAALVANGLGGGSLINAGVCEPAQPQVFAHKDWPEPWLGNAALWQSLYQRARVALGAQPWPAGRVAKQAAMVHLAERLDAEHRPVWLSIVPPDNATTPTTASADGDEAPLVPCIECGDCFTGCNVGAKRTLGHNYLARAHRQGAQLFTGATVHSVLPLPADANADTDTGPDAPRWLVRWRLTDPARLPGGQQLFEVRARHVVLAAGTYGSTEILMRSREAGLAVSGRLGDGFSANGDVLSAYYDIGNPVGISPDENSALATRRAGPTITTQLHWNTRPGDGHLAPLHTLQDLTVPGALGWIFSEVLTSMMVPQRWTRWNFATERRGGADPYAVDAQAMARSLLTVAYVNDGACGRLEPGVGWATASRDGALRVRWKDVGDAAPFLQMDAQLKAAKPTGADYLRNPIWQFMPERDYMGLGQTNRRLFTVHPLGGCRMASNARDGVVDPWGRVFDCGGELGDLGDPRAEARRTERAGQHDRSVHAGLAVLDGAIVPTALGINPMLTITALAEGAIDHWQQQERWVQASVQASPTPTPQPLLQLPTVPASRPQPQATAVQFNEVMLGQVAPLGEANAAPRYLRMLARFEPVPDLPAFLAQPVKTVQLQASFMLEDDKQQLLSTLALKGTVDWFAIEPSCVGERAWRVLRNYWHSRLAADQAEARHTHKPLLKGLASKLRGGTHFGALRRLEYHFTGVPEGWLGLPAKCELRGVKRVGYRMSSPADPESANPWRQLGELTLWAHPDKRRRIRLGVLKFQEMAALDRYTLPLKVVQQENAVAALRDTARLGLYFGRLMFGLHMFSFRRAEYPAEINGPRGLQRLPPLAYAADDARFHGLRICRHTVGVPQAGRPPLTLLLTRLRGAQPTTGLPVVLVHGFGSGGIQFTHPAIPQPMAPWLAQRGHDVWVVELRTSIGLDSADRQWSMDLVAQHDIPALLRAVLALSGQPQVHVVAHCIGSAMFCMAMLSGRLQEGATKQADNPLPTGGQNLVASAVLMQVGPRVQLPIASRARAYVAMRLRQLVGAAQAHSVASQDIGDMEALMDRVFGTYLYPEDQRPYYRLNHDLARNTTRINANRSAAVFGQLFQYQNMTPALMAALPDLLGSCNLTTYEQTAQYAFEHRLTNQNGEDVYTSEARLRAYFDVPVTLLHGDRNKTFDPKTLDRNRNEFQSAGLRARAILIKGFGHLDCVVGQGADAAVFTQIHAHLSHPCFARPTGGYEAVLRLPRVGPWLGHVQPVAKLGMPGMLQLRVGLRVDEPGRALLGVATLLCDASETPLGEIQRHPCVPDRHEQVLEVQVPSQPAGAQGPVRLLVAAVHGQWPASAQALVQAVATKNTELAAAARRQLTPVLANDGLLLDRAWLQRMAAGRADQLGLALGACRQRPLLTDRDLADASMGHLCQALDDACPAGHAPLDLVLLAGDQVYADTRIDTGHVGALKRQYFDAHQEAWSAPQQRALMRRRPVVMAVDDHEFRNDYNNQITRGRPQEFSGAATAWQRYQLEAGPTPPVRRTDLPGQGLRVAWRSFAHCGFHFFVCDTRSERKDINRVDRRGASIMSSEQMGSLQDWLLQLQQDTQHGDRPKVVVTGTPVAPWFRNAQGATGESTWGDGWQRFPDSVGDLLQWIAEHQIQNVLFLSGDYHLHADLHLQLQAPGKAVVNARSIVTGGLYSPYPFANAQRSEWLDGAEAQNLVAGTTRWSYQLKRSTAGSGYTRITLLANGGVQADFVAVSPAILPGTAVHRPA